MSKSTPWFLTAPSLTILALVIVGALVNGVEGAVIGFFAGVIVVSGIGWIVRRKQGGHLPRQVRLTIVTDVLTREAEVVAAAFPGMSGADLHRAVESSVEHLAAKAVSLSPSPDDRVTFTLDNLALAVKALCGEETDPARVYLYDAIWRQFLIDGLHW